MPLTPWKKLNAGRPAWLGVKRHGGGAQLCLTCVHSLLSLGLGRRGLCILQRRWDREATQRFKETGSGGGRGAKHLRKRELLLTGVPCEREILTPTGGEDGWARQGCAIGGAYSRKSSGRWCGRWKAHVDQDAKLRSKPPRVGSASGEMARRDDSQASTWPSWIEALCFPFGERSAKMG